MSDKAPAKAAEKKTRAKAEVKIQKKLDNSAYGIPEEFEVYVDVPTKEPIASTAKAKSILNKLEKKVGDEMRIIGVKKTFKTAVTESVAVVEQD